MFYIIYFDSILKRIYYRLCNVSFWRSRYYEVYRSIEELGRPRKDFPRETFITIGRKLSQADIYYTENEEYVILYKKKLN